MVHQYIRVWSWCAGRSCNENIRTSDDETTILFPSFNPMVKSGTRLLLISGHHSLERKCSDCAYMQAHITWWCTSEEAVEYRKTSIPGTKNCQFWAPCETIKKGLFARIKQFFQNDWLKVKRE